LTATHKGKLARVEKEDLSMGTRKLDAGCEVRLYYFEITGRLHIEKKTDIAQQDKETKVEG
jgi:hypothetical protein